MAFIVLTACGGSVEKPATPPEEASPATAAWDLDWARGAVFYEIFVRSFADSDGDGIGDFAGLTSRLDYLNDGDPATDHDLGVDGLWLMPVFASPSYHGYDVTDYETVNPDYGTAEDFERFLEEAHRRGIRVIVDLVMNHSSSKHPWFLESSSSPESPYRDWYVWRSDNPGWKQPWGGRYPTWHRAPGGDEFYYGIFWSGMPDLNFENPAVREEMKRLARLWIERGVDGFRLDATRHLMATGDGEGQNNAPGTHAFLRELAAHVRSFAPRAFLVGENWTDTPTIATYYGSTDEVAGGDELPSNFNFPLAAAIVEGVRSGDEAGIVWALNEMADYYPEGVVDSTFLTNHDQLRLATQLDGDPARLALAASILLTLPGTPFLYYGEEVGLANGGPDRQDELKRTPMPWNGDAPGHGFSTGDPWFRFAPGHEIANVAHQTDDPRSLLSHYRRLIRLRKAHPALARGDLALLDAGAGGFAFVREHAGERLLVAHNLRPKDAVLRLAVAATGAEALFAAGKADLEMGDTAEVELGAMATGVWRLEPAKTP